MAIFQPTRTEIRGHLPVGIRVERLEEDADVFERSVDKIHDAIKETRKESRDEMKALKRIGVSLLASTTGGAILLVLNLIAGRHP